MAHLNVFLIILLIFSISFYRDLCEVLDNSITDHENDWEPLCKLSGAQNFEEKQIPDCNCHVYSVDQAVNSFISPLLSNLTERTFFRYFHIDLEKPCPFWTENGQCMIKDCSVCTCQDNEIPLPWLAHSMSSSLPAYSEEFIGWVSPSTSSYGFGGKGHDESLGVLDYGSNSKKKGQKGYNSSLTSNYVKHLIETEQNELEDWTFIAHESQSNSALGRGVYVNLLQNPERYTGYAGPSAQRVWHAIQQENCFGGLSDTCLEKRIFFRLMSGLQSSISTHIARNYLNASTNSWGENPDLFMKAVGNHPDRLQNMYFAFLFVLRSVIKAGDILVSYNFNTGNVSDDTAVRQLIANLVGKTKGSAHPMSTSAMPYSAVVDGKSNADRNVKAIEECKHGFDESEMFQISQESQPASAAYRHRFEEKHKLREEFKTKFRNISSIMDCVGCEKCRLWGKLQILGIGTAIKVLLMSPSSPSSASSSSCDHHMDAQDPHDGRDVKDLVVNRQEVIALLNTLNQLSKSIVFASRMMAKHNDNRDNEDYLSRQKEEKSAGQSDMKATTEPILKLRTDGDLYLMKKSVGINKLNIKAKAKARNNAATNLP